jgi:hypothetical protein
MAKADWPARLIFLPNSIKHNLPESPNVLRAWANAFNELPECELKAEILQRLSSVVGRMGEGFRKAFTEVFGEALPKGLAIQEQKQEQEQKQSQEQEGTDQVRQCIRSQAATRAHNFQDRQKRKAFRLPDDFSLIENRERVAVDIGVSNPEHEFEKFCDYYKGAGVSKVDWDATWSLWCRRAVEDRQFRPGGQTRNGHKDENVFETNRRLRREAEEASRKNE